MPINGIYLILLLTMGGSMLISWQLRRRFRRYSQIRLRANLSGQEIAEQMLHDFGIHQVRVVSVPGRLSDHYNPADRTVNLSQEVFHGRNAAAAAVAAHECGHAVQHAKAYTFLKFRSAMVPVLSVTSRFMPWLLLGGIFLMQTTVLPLTLGVALFALTTLFSFVTLPVEFDASRRALAWIKQREIVTADEYGMAKDALRWAAMTYVVAALGSLATLLYYASFLMGRRD